MISDMSPLGSIQGGVEKRKTHGAGVGVGGGVGVKLESDLCKPTLRNDGISSHLKASKLHFPMLRKNGGSRIEIKRVRNFFLILLNF